MIKAIDFFCGAGGLTRGLLNAGISVLAGVDNDERLRLTYENNNQPSRFMCEDIRSLSILKLRRQLGITNDDVVLYAACTPCQPFSTLNQMKGKDERKNLLLSFAKLIHKIPPDFILVENVPGLNSKFGKEIYDEFAQIIKDCGFINSSAAFLDAKDFEVPQVRKRFILLASREGEIKLPEPVSKTPLTVRDCIKRFPAVENERNSIEFLNHVARPLPTHHKKIVEAVPTNGGSRSDIKDTSILLKCHQKNPEAHKDVFGRMSWDKPAPTLTARCTDVYCGRFIHPDQHRGISLREGAALQTFADNYEFFGTYHHIQKQIGNAVPVKFAEHLGKTIVDIAARLKDTAND